MGSSVRHIAEQQKWKDKIPDIYKSTKKRSSLVFNQAYFEEYARSLFIIVHDLYQIRLCSTWPGQQEIFLIKELLGRGEK